MKLSLDFTTVLFSLKNEEIPVVALSAKTLPRVQFEPQDKEPLEKALRRKLQEITGLTLGYMEQLYTFGNYGRLKKSTDTREVSIAYVSLVKDPTRLHSTYEWIPLYDILPWEDLRNFNRQIIQKSLKNFASQSKLNSDRVKIAYDLFTHDTISHWDRERVHERFEILFDAGLVDENGKNAVQSTALCFDHRRIVASALSRLRGKIRYRPIVFELMNEEFTLYELQLVVEALSGENLHKQNFRRLVEQSDLVEPLGRSSKEKRGRPAEVFRFRREVLLERPTPGIGPKSFPVVR